MGNFWSIYGEWSPRGEVPLETCMPRPSRSNSTDSDSIEVDGERILEATESTKIRNHSDANVVQENMARAFQEYEDKKSAQKLSVLDSDLKVCFSY